MKIYILILSTIMLCTFDVFSDLLVPGATLTGNGVNVYDIYSDNGLDDNDPSFLAVLLETNINLVNANHAILSPGSFISLTPGHMWYEVSVDHVVDPSLILTASTCFYNGMRSGYNHVVEETITMNSFNPFYLGYWIAKGSSSVPGSGDVFGWTKLSYDGTTLHLLDSAAETSGAGIVAGRYEVVPEPSSGLLLIVGSGGLLFYRRAKLRKNSKHRCR